jgi:hypothetical protein
MNNHIHKAIIATIADAVRLNAQITALVDVYANGVHMVDAEKVRDVKRLLHDNTLRLWDTEAILGSESFAGIADPTTEFNKAVQEALWSIDFSAVVKDAVQEAINDTDWSDHDLVTSDSLEGYVTEYLSGVDWNEYDLITESEVDNKVEDLCDEDRVHDIVDGMISSLEVVIKRAY